MLRCESNAPDNSESSISHRFVRVWSSWGRRIAGHRSATGHKNSGLVNEWRTTGGEARVRGDTEALTRRHQTPVTNQRHRSALYDRLSGSYSFTGQPGRQRNTMADPCASSLVSWAHYCAAVTYNSSLPQFHINNCCIHILRTSVRLAIRPSFCRPRNSPILPTKSTLTQTNTNIPFNKHKDVTWPSQCTSIFARWRARASREQLNFSLFCAIRRNSD